MISGEDYIAEYLYENREILNFLSPMPKPPQYLYRGLHHLNSVPSINQNVEYSPKYRISSWSNSINIAQGFCKEQRYSRNSIKEIVEENIAPEQRERIYDIIKSLSSGVLLQANSKDILNQHIFLWPISSSFLSTSSLFKDVKSLRGETEYACLLVSTFSIYDWYYCINDLKEKLRKIIK